MVLNVHRNHKAYFVATKVCLSRKKIKKILYKHVLYLSPNNSFVATNLILSRQKFCRNKHTFVATKDLFCRDKAFVATKIVLAAVTGQVAYVAICTIRLLSVSDAAV